MSCHKKRGSLIPLVHDFNSTTSFEDDNESEHYETNDYSLDQSPPHSRPPSVAISRSASRNKSPEPTPCHCNETTTPYRTTTTTNNNTHSTASTSNNNNITYGSSSSIKSSSRILDSSSSPSHLLNPNTHTTSSSFSPGGDNTVRVAVDGHQARASLSQHDGLHFQYDITRCCVPGVCAESIPYSEILSAKVLPPVKGKFWNPFPQNMHRLAVYTFRRSAITASHWLPRRVIIESAAEGMLHQWANHINITTASYRGRPRHVLVIVNPYGGKKKAPSVFDRAVLPVFERAGIKAEVQLTQFCGHARGIILDMTAQQLGSIDGVVAVGGDGLFHEIINGLLELRSAQNQHDVRATAASSIRVGHIPAGSTDAVACTLNGTRSAFTAAMHIALGDALPLDVLRIDFADGRKEWAASMTSYGFFGDVMKEGETMRWLGPMRYDVVGAKMLAANRFYRCRVSYLPAQATRRKAFTSVCGVGCDVCSTGASVSGSGSNISLVRAGSGALGTGNVLNLNTTSTTTLLNGGGAATTTNTINNNNNKPGHIIATSAVTSSCGSGAEDGSLLPNNNINTNNNGAGISTSTTTTTTTNIKPKISPSPSSALQFHRHSSRALLDRSDDWKTIEDDFAGVQLVIMPCRSDKSLQGVAKYGHLSDGNIHLVLVRKCSRLQYLQFLLRLSHQGLEPGKHGSGGYIEVIPAVAVKVEPMDAAVTSQWNVDGELVDCAAMTAETHRAAIEVFARGVEN